MNLRFSQRNGFKQVRSIIQVESIDQPLKAGIWNVLSIHYWNLLGNFDSLDKNIYIKNLVNLIWSDYFKITTDTINYGWKENLMVIREYFFSSNRNWYDIYDLIEFIANCKVFPDYFFKNDKFKSDCNRILEREMSAYRFVGNFIVPIIDEIEINEIETVLKDKSKTKFASVHLSNALDMLSDRNNPDYRNSIKESISAVESIAKSISGESKAELKPALKVLEDKMGIEIHGALREGFLKIYGYTSDGDGIRHALIEEANLSFEDAKFMIVACSSFVNYLVAKADKAGIDL